MGKTLLALTAKLTADTSKFKGGLDKGKRELGGFSKSVGKIGGMIAGAFAVGAIISFTQESARLAGEAEGIYQAFDKLNKPGLLADLQNATRDTVSDVNLMKAAVQAKNFKIPLDQLATYFEFATKRAAETGESVDYLVESIINGIGRKSPMILDNLGISASELSAEFKRTGDFGQAAGDIIRGELANMGDVMLTNAQKQAALTAETENFKIALGNVVNTVKGELAPALTNLMADATADLAVLNKIITDDTIPVWQKLLGAVLESHGVKAFDHMNKKIEEAAEATADAIEITEEKTEAEVIQITTLKDLQDQLTKVNAEITASNILDVNSIAVLNDKSKALQDQIKWLKALNGESLKRTASPEKLTAINGFAAKPNDDLGWQDDIDDFDRMLAIQEAQVDQYSANVQVIEDRTLQLSETVQAAMGSMVTSFAEDIGNMITGVGSFDDLLSNLASMFGDFLVSMGEAITAYGISMLAFQEALSNPIGAILAGAALVVAGVVVRNMAAEGMETGGIVPPGYPNDTYPAMLTSGETVTPAIPLPKSSSNNNNPVIMDVRISGNDLLLTQRRTEQHRNRIT